MSQVRLPRDQVKNGRAPKEKWMGLVHLVKAQGYKSELMKKYGTIKRFCDIADIPYYQFNDFLNGRNYWRKKFAHACEQYLHGKLKHIGRGDVVYDGELDNMKMEIKLLFGSTKEMCEELEYLTKDEVYKFASNLKFVRTKKRAAYWKMRTAIAEKKLALIHKSQIK